MPKARPSFISRHSSLSYQPDTCEITPLLRRTSQQETRQAYKKGKIVGAALSFSFMLLIGMFVIFYDRIIWEREDNKPAPPVGAELGQLFDNLEKK